MKLQRLIAHCLAVMLTGSVLVFGAAVSRCAEADVVIQSIKIQGPNLLVTVRVPAGVKKVTLESRTRLGGGTWEPRAVQRIEGGVEAGQTVVFQVGFSEKMELLRVRGDTSDVLPASFYSGTNSFGSFDTSGGAKRDMNEAGPVADVGSSPPTENREVVESDIWKIAGDTLYFFNQYRGLQVIDIGQPDAPVVRGTYALAAAGEQMYLPDWNHVVLLARDSCWGWGAESQSQVVLLEVVNGQPNLVASLALEGQVAESRMVGTALYVVCNLYRHIRTPDGKEFWEWGSTVTAFDLSQFNNPVRKGDLWISGYSNVIMATDKFLCVASPYRNGQWTSQADVDLFDIASPDGSIEFLSTIPVAGQVKDKFKMNIRGGVLAVVTENWSAGFEARVETFSIADPRKPVKLGNLKIIEREQLHATRFAGDLLYAVTFFRIDPLWIIDLRDPAQPQKVGELQIPGWSTYLQPLGERLLAIGRDDTSNSWRTAVQLFDVGDPAKPFLLSKVLIGETYSYSEANWDEKAFGVLPEQKLVLVPFSGNTTAGQWTQGVQLIDLEERTLVKRGVIEQHFGARRATRHDNRVLTLSGLDLYTVDATDRDHPKVTAETPLAWSTDRLYLSGDYLIGAGLNWDKPSDLLVMRTADPSQVLNRVRLADLPFVGAALRDRRLYVLQGKGAEYVWPKEWNPTNYYPVATNAGTLLLSIYDATQLPALALEGEVKRAVTDTQWLGLHDAFWPKPGVLVWASAAQNQYGRWYVVDAVASGPIAGDSIGRGMPFWWAPSEQRLFAYDVGAPARPEFLSEVNVRGTNDWWNFSRAFSAGELIMFSHQTSEYLADVQPPPQVYERWDGSKYVTTTNIPSPGVWVQRYYLDVVNYADPREPGVRKPVSIPGGLAGISHNGALLYTQGYHGEQAWAWNDWTEWFEASAYDGASAFLVASMRLPQEWPHPTLVTGRQFFLGRPANTNQPAAAIETWTLSDAGQFVRLGTIGVKNAAQQFKATGDLLDAQTGYNELQIFDATDPAVLKPMAQGQTSGCLGFTLDNAVGTLERGIWIPLGLYGIWSVPISPKTP